ncbi:MAG: hypothetical protein HY332_17430 [Chloroflexi bacterium]|nr:hypothetical protein [Chloroflexota bacterium]
MASRKKGRTADSSRSRLPVNRSLTLIGDVRTGPMQVRDDDGRLYHPDVAIWAQPDTGLIWGMMVGKPGERAQTLVHALVEAGPPPFGPREELPGKLVLFDEALAREVRLLLDDPRIAFELTEPFDEFDELFRSFFEHYEQQRHPTLDLPDPAIAALCKACARLWRAKPWQYVHDYPPLELVPQDEPPLYASVLGANREVLGIALYGSLDDLERFVEVGEEVVGPPGTPLPPPDDEEADEILEALRHRTILISFDRRSDVVPEYRDQLAKNGWPRRTTVVPTFGAMGGDAPPGDINEDEAGRAALAIEALVTFCERHEDELTDEDYPIEETVEVERDGRPVQVRVKVPPDELLEDE